jgi:PAS domain S-box-containing protein
MKENTMTILIVEDDAGISELLNMTLEEHGYSTFSVNSGGDAINWLQNNQCRLMILDYGLPDMDGKEFLKKLSKTDKLIPPFIVGTGVGDERIAVEMMKMGAIDYIVKDTNFLDIIIEVIKRVLKEIENENKLKTIEKSLRKKEQQLSSILNNSSIHIWTFDGFKHLYFNKVYCDFLGLKKSIKLTLEDWEKYIHPDDLSGLTKVWMEVWEDKKEFDTYFRMKSIKDEYRYFWCHALPIYDENGKFSYFQGFNIDITERQRIEEEKSRFMTAIEQTAETVVITDIKGNIQYVNPAFEKITGYSSEEAIGQNPRILQSGKHDKKFYKEMWNSLKNGETWRGRFINKKKNGKLYTEEVVISPVRDKNGKTGNFVAVKRDISDQIELEAKLLQAQKMESIGRLAGGVAHDFNNMLSVIIGHTEIALENMDQAHQFYTSLTEISKAANRSADLTRQLLAFARKQTIIPKVLNLNHTLEGMNNMLGRLIGEDVTLKWLPGEDLWKVRVDPSQIDQILVNLCVNARDVIENVGKVTIETENFIVDKEFCVDHLGLYPGEYICLSVSDNGHGMENDILDNIFEPFFTTKEIGKGTGLGLSTVYGIVKQNNGCIYAYSEIGIGTTFKVYLPRYMDINTEVQKKIIGKSLEQGNETILVVEDELMILKVIKKILARQGYTVIAANSPDEALCLVEDHQQIQLLITDVVMPGMNGKDLAKTILSSYPNIKYLFMSGFTKNVIAGRGFLDKDSHFIQKPFSIESITTKIRHILDS